MTTKTKPEGRILSAAKLEHYQRCEKELEERRIKDILRWAVDEFVGNLGVLAANTPHDKWPEAFKVAFEHAFRGRGKDLKDMYLSRLPK